MSASFGKLIFDKRPLALFTEELGMSKPSVNMLQSVVPMTTNKMYGTLLSAFTLTVPELLRKIQTIELVIIGANAQKKPRKDCLYIDFRSRFAI